MTTIYDIRPDYFPEEFQLQAVNELRETPEIRAQALVELRKLLAEAKDLYYADDDDFLTIFLRPTKYYPESAMKLVSSWTRHMCYQLRNWSLQLDNSIPIFKLVLRKSYLKMPRNIYKLEL